MTKAKYKVGDRLKIVQDPGRRGYKSNRKVGDYFKVRDVYHSDSVHIYYDTKYDGIFEEDLELAEIADSPLGKALT